MVGLGRGARRARHRARPRASCCRGGWRRSARSPAACRGHRRRGAASCRGGRGRWGSGRSSWPATSAPFCGDRGAVDRGPAPVERLGRGQPLQEHPVQSAEHAVRTRPRTGGGQALTMPVAQPAPAGPAPDPDPGSCPCNRTPPEATVPSRRPTAARTRCPRAPVGHSTRGRPPFGFGGSGGSKRRHRRPQLVAHKGPGHGPQRHTPRWVLLGALRPGGTRAPRTPRDQGGGSRGSRPSSVRTQPERPSNTAAVSARP